MPPNQLDALLGLHQRIPHAPHTVAVGIPIETIARRPDIHQSRLEQWRNWNRLVRPKQRFFPPYL